MATSKGQVVRWLSTALSSSRSSRGLPELSSLVVEYRDLLTSHLPSITSTSDADPLSDPLSGGDEDQNSAEGGLGDGVGGDKAGGSSNDNDEGGAGGGASSWSKFHSANELMNEVQIDMERLYLNNLPPSYFQDSPERLEALSNVLFLTCTQLDKEVGYRQGMHEVRVDDTNVDFNLLRRASPLWFAAVGLLTPPPPPFTRSPRAALRAGLLCHRSLPLEP